MKADWAPRMRLMALLVLAFACLLGIARSAAGASADAGPIELLSRYSTGEPAGGGGVEASPDGARVAFNSVDLLEPFEGGRRLYIADTETGALAEVPESAGGSGSGSAAAAWSPDGRKLAFLKGLFSASVSLYVYDTQTSASTLLADGTVTAGEGLSLGVSWSPDSRKVSYVSRSTPSFTSQVVYADVETKAAEVVSSTSEGSPGNGPSHQSVWSPIGNRVAFLSSSTNLDSGTSGGFHVYVKDLDTGRIDLIDQSPEGVPGDDLSSGKLTWSPDGSQLAFLSAANNLIPGVTGYQMYRANLTTGTLALVSASANGTPFDGVLDWGTALPAWSPDGSRILFRAWGSSFDTPIPSSETQLYTKNVETGVVELVSAAVDGTPANDFTIESGSTSAWSRDSSRVLFRSEATSLTEDSNGRQHVYVKNLETGTVILASSSSDGTPGDGIAGSSTWGTSVRDVVFASAASNLVADDTNGTTDVFIKRLGGSEPPPPNTFKYVALGDSYSSGEGIDPYFRDGYDSSTETQPGDIDNRCHRSTRAYAQYIKRPTDGTWLYALASGGGDPGTGKRINKYGSDQNVRAAEGVEWVFWACSGAKTINVLPSALGGERQNDGQYREEHTQLDNPSVDASTDLITITIGGNDVLFADVLRLCFETSCNTPTLRSNLESAIDGLQVSLVRVYEAIQTKAPSATLIVLGYPQIFPPAARQSCQKLRPWRGEMDMLRDMGVRLNSVIEDSAASVGATYLDPNITFAGHEVCSFDEWIYGPSTSYKKSRNFVDDESFHPNLKGRAAYAELVNDELG